MILLTNYSDHNLDFAWLEYAALTALEKLELDHDRLRIVVRQRDAWERAMYPTRMGLYSNHEVEVYTDANPTKAAVKSTLWHEVYHFYQHQSGLPLDDAEADRFALLSHILVN